MVSLVAGDETKIPDLIDYMMDQSEVWLGRYAKTLEFKVDGDSSTSI